MYILIYIRHIDDVISRKTILRTKFLSFREDTNSHEQREEQAYKLPPYSLSRTFRSKIICWLLLLFKDIALKYSFGRFFITFWSMTKWCTVYSPEQNRTFWVDVSRICSLNLHHLLTVTQSVPFFFGHTVW